MPQESSYNHNQNEHYLVRIQGEVKCICELCNCGSFQFDLGKHKCPTKRIVGDFQTSYNNHYKNYNVNTLLYHPKYNYNERHYNPETLRTNYQETYIPLQNPQPSKVVSRLQSIGRVVLKSEPFIGQTSYKEEYKPFKIQNEINEAISSPMSEKLKDSRQRGSIKFQGESSYKSAHHPLPIPKIDRYRPPEYKPTKQFQGSSSYKDNYLGYRIEPVKEIVNTPNNNKQIKFEGSSTYNNHYGTFKVAPQSIQMVGNCKLDSLNLGANRYLKNDSLHELQEGKYGLK